MLEDTRLGLLQIWEADWFAHQCPITGGTQSHGDKVVSFELQFTVHLVRPH